MRERYHLYGPENETHGQALDTIRKAFADLDDLLDDLLPGSGCDARTKAIAKTYLEESCMFAIKSSVIHGPVTRKA